MRSHERNPGSALKGFPVMIAAVIAVVPLGH
jgi:hypothetical protein